MTRRRVLVGRKMNLIECRVLEIMCVRTSRSIMMLTRRSKVRVLGIMSLDLVAGCFLEDFTHLLFEEQKVLHIFSYK